MEHFEESVSLKPIPIPQMEEAKIYEPLKFKGNPNSKEDI